MKWVLSLLLALVGTLAQAQDKGLGYVKPTPAARAAMYKIDNARNGARIAAMAKNLTAPAKFDCVEMGWVPPVRDQGNCGSCYGVATADQLTCTFIKSGHQKSDDSFEINFQFGLDGCGPNFGGCNGGWGAEVAEWMVGNGFPAERYIDANGKKVNDYPAYEARPRNCREKAGAKRWKPEGWGFCAASANHQATVDEIKASLMQYGVVNIAFAATSAYSNAGTGVIKITSRGVNHETTLVGWDDSKKAWKTRGNWGTGLGDGGYVWMHYDSYLEDPFWMTATPLPPPPPPPPPPDPIPPDPIPPGPTPTGTLITLNKDLKRGIYKIVPAKSVVITPEMTIGEVIEAMRLVKEGVEPPITEKPDAKVEPKPCPQTKQLEELEKWKKEREKNEKSIVEAILKIQEVLTGQKSKAPAKKISQLPDDETSRLIQRVDSLILKGEVLSEQIATARKEYDHGVLRLIP